MKILFQLFVLFLPVLLHAQISISNCKNEQTNILYNNRINVIRVSGISETVPNIELKGMGFTAKETGKGIYEVTVTAKKLVTLLVYSNNKIVAEQKFEVTECNREDYDVTFANILKNEISRETILANPFLLVSGGCVCEKKSTVVKFNLITSKMYVRYISGSVLGEDDKAAIKSLQPGDKVILEDIGVADNFGVIKLVPARTYIIK